MSKSKASTKTNPRFSMLGSENTGNYVVVGYTGRGRIGVRALIGLIDPESDLHKARIRVEPINSVNAVAKMSQTLQRSLDWKQPGDDEQNRFSKVTTSSSSAEVAIVLGLVALGVSDGLVFTVNPKAPKWLKDLVKHTKASKVSASTDKKVAAG